MILMRLRWPVWTGMAPSVGWSCSSNGRQMAFFTLITKAANRTNCWQRKGRILHALESLRRQVRVVGPVSQVSPAQSDAYFASRGRGSQIGAWSSAQSQPLASRAELAAAVVTSEARFPMPCRDRRIGVVIALYRRKSNSG